MANFWPKVGHHITFAPTLNGHNPAIYIRLWRSTTLKWPARRDKSNAKLYLSFLDFGPFFCSKASHGQHSVYGPKTTLKLLVQALAMAPTHSSKSIYTERFRPEPPLLLKTWRVNNHLWIGKNWSYKQGHVHMYMWHLRQP